LKDECKKKKKEDLNRLRKGKTPLAWEELVKGGERAERAKGVDKPGTGWGFSTGGVDKQRTKEKGRTIKRGGSANSQESVLQQNEKKMKTQRGLIRQVTEGGEKADFLPRETNK